MVKEDLAYCPNQHKSSIHILLKYNDEKHSTFFLSVKATQRFERVLSLAMEGNEILKGSDLLGPLFPCFLF